MSEKPKEITPPKVEEPNEGDDTLGEGPYDQEEETGEDMEALDIA